MKHAHRSWRLRINELMTTARRYVVVQELKERTVMEKVSFTLKKAFLVVRAVSPGQA